jgi:hypothetical protein
MTPNVLPTTSGQLQTNEIVYKGKTASMNVTWKGRNLTVAVTYSHDIVDQAKAKAAIEKSLDKMILLADTYKLGQDGGKTQKISVKTDGTMTRERTGKPVKNYADVNKDLNDKLTGLTTRQAGTLKPHETQESVKSRIDLLTSLTQIFKKIQEEQKTIQQNNNNSIPPTTPAPIPKKPLPNEQTTPVPSAPPANFPRTPLPTPPKPSSNPKSETPPANLGPIISNLDDDDDSTAGKVSKSV